MGALIDKLFPHLKKERDKLQRQVDDLSQRLGRANDELAQLLIENASLKQKIQPEPEKPKLIRAKTSAEVRRIVEEQNEREMETADGIR